MTDHRYIPLPDDAPTVQREERRKSWVRRNPLKVFLWASCIGMLLWGGPIMLLLWVAFMSLFGVWGPICGRSYHDRQRRLRRNAQRRDERQWGNNNGPY